RPIRPACPTTWATSRRCRRRRTRSWRPSVPLPRIRARRNRRARRSRRLPSRRSRRRTEPALVLDKDVAAAALVENAKRFAALPAEQADVLPAVVAAEDALDDAFAVERARDHTERAPARHGDDERLGWPPEGQVGELEAAVAEARAAHVGGETRRRLEGAVLVTPVARVDERRTGTLVGARREDVDAALGDERVAEGVEVARGLAQRRLDEHDGAAVGETIEERAD